ncbi:MAG: hypothetical protein IJC07_04580 [Clostridia bacterium]|nr:hypothetical protein [Clostridia bacterium]
MLKLTNKGRAISIALFSFIQLIFLIAVQIIWGDALSIVCFSSVATAVLFCYLFLKKDLVWLFTALAMTFTLIADVFLVLLSPQNQLFGMIFFFIVQLLYGARFFVEETNKKSKLIFVTIRALLMAIAVAVTFIVLKDGADLVSVLSVVYYANLILNIVLAIKSKNLLLSLGLIFFALCDAFVGLQVMASSYIPINPSSVFHSIIYPPFNVVWLFYVPSQTLIAISQVNRHSI